MTQRQYFSPIVREIINPNKSYPFNIYLQEEDQVFTCIFQSETDVPEVIFDKTKETLYIKSSDKKLYQIYLDEYVKTIIKSDTIKLDNKVTVVKAIAHRIMKNIFEDSKLNVENIKEAGQAVENVVEVMLSDDNAMHSMLKVTSHDYYTYTHCIDVALYAISFGAYLKLQRDDLNTIGKGAMFHDIGKKDIDAAIINKNGKLTIEEFRKMKRHPSLGVYALRMIGEFEDKIIKIVEQHHEKCNGKGYPYGLSANEIDDFAKIVAICDVFAAMTTKRSYKDRIDSYNSLSIMTKQMKGELCPKYLKKFIEFMRDEIKIIGNSLDGNL